jgi:hypothetical protein
MALLDKQLILSDAQTLVAAAGAINSSNVIDLWGSAALPSGPLGTPVFDPGRGEDVEVLCQIVDTYLAAAGASTVKVALVNSDDAGLVVNPIVLAESEAIPKADLVAGYRFRIPSCLPYKVSKRYLGAIITIATNDGTAGKITIALCMGYGTAPGEVV